MLCFSYHTTIIVFLDVITGDMYARNITTESHANEYSMPSLVNKGHNSHDGPSIAGMNDDNIGASYQLPLQYYRCSVKLHFLLL